MHIKISSVGTKIIIKKYKISRFIERKMERLNNSNNNNTKSSTQRREEENINKNTENTELKEISKTVIST